MIFVIGLFPSIFLDRMKDSVQLAYDQFKAVSGQSRAFGDDRGAKMLGAEVFNPKFLEGAPVPSDAAARASERTSAVSGGGDGAKAVAAVAGGAK